MIFYWAVSVKRWGQKPSCSQLESGDSECYHFREVLLMKGRKEEKARGTVLPAEEMACAKILK